MTDQQREVIRHVLAHYGHRGHRYPAGSFTRHILEAFQCADPVNFARLSGAFPDYGAAMWTAMNTNGGLDALAAQLAESRPDLKVVTNETPEGAPVP